MKVKILLQNILACRKIYKVPYKGIAVTVNHNGKSAFSEAAYKLKNAASPDRTFNLFFVQI